MSQPATHPHHVSQLLQPALNGIVAALADRGGQSVPEYDARALETWILIQSFQPRDAIDLLLTGQLVAFNELFADGTRDLLRGMVDTMKQRTRSTLVAMGRITQGHVDRLETRGLQPYRTEAPAPQPAQHAASAAKAKAAGQRARPTVAATPAASPTAIPRPAAAATEPPVEPDTDDTAAQSPVAATSWLDEPYEEWVIETPADLALKASAVQTADVTSEAKHWCIDNGAPPVDTAADPDFRHRSRDAPASAVANAAAGD